MCTNTIHIIAYYTNTITKSTPTNKQTKRNIKKQKQQIKECGNIIWKSEIGKNKHSINTSINEIDFESEYQSPTVGTYFLSIQY